MFQQLLDFERPGGHRDHLCLDGPGAADVQGRIANHQNFIALQSQLEGTENRIAIARRDYNEAVRVYNTTLHTFPGVIWAGTLYKNEKPMQLFAATEAAQDAPKVSFAPSGGQ